MTSKQKQNSIKQTLDISSSQLSPSTLEKLRMARSKALEHQRTNSTAPVFAWLGNHSDKNGNANTSRSLQWAVAALFVAFLFSGATYWEDYTHEDEISEVDVSILTDELPIHVYLD
jgi:Protein of unknown function (DUF3619)